MIITLSHSIEIDAAPEAVYSFFVSIEKNYTTWHPDHVAFRWVKGNSLEEGAEAHSEQYVDGSLHRLTARFTRVIPTRRVEFEWVNPIARFFAPPYLRLFEPSKSTSRSGCRWNPLSAGFRDTIPRTRS